MRGSEFESFVKFIFRKTSLHMSVYLFAIIVQFLNKKGLIIDYG